ncbi:hypothetical protein ACQ4PT_005517 [Festuca glaucescens]
MNDHDCMNMAGAVAVGHRELSIYVDHADSIPGYTNDAVFQFPSPQQPTFVNEPEEFLRKPREKRRLNFDTDFEFDSDGSDFEEEIVDSDYDLYEGDDDLYEECIEEDEDRKGKKLAEEVEGAESDHELELPKSDDEQVKFKFNNFTLVDMANPQFKVGQTFTSVELLRKAIREYSCRERVNISMPTNYKDRIAARCHPTLGHCGNPGHNKSGCSWYKAGMPPKKQRRKKSRAMLDDSEEEDVPVITQENSVPAGQNRGNYTFSDLNAGNPTVENVEDTMLEEMVNQVPAPNTRSVHPSPLPDCTFISAEQSQNVAPGGSSSGVEHKIAAKAEAIKLTKLREYEEKKEASVAAKLKKSAEAKLLKSELAQKRRLQAQQKKEEAAESRKLAAAEKKEALLAARQQQAAQKEAEKARKAAAKQQQAEQRRATKPSTSHPKKVSMFDELRG